MLDYSLMKADVSVERNHGIRRLPATVGRREKLGSLTCVSACVRPAAETALPKE
ncbi:MAG: hypothetical protein N2V73_04175 [Candidatus Methanospirare jalkutatii]|nr:hypothetical protein [Candidatus Methanospirare jalkutatii]